MAHIQTRMLQYTLSHRLHLRCTIAGAQVRVTAEVYPLEVCASVAWCQVDGESGHHDVRAEARAPFDTWGVTQPQLRECFVTCKLPQPGMKLNWIHLRRAPTQPAPAVALQLVCSPLLLLLSTSDSSEQDMKQTEQDGVQHNLSCNRTNDFVRRLVGPSGRASDVQGVLVGIVVTTQLDALSVIHLS